MKKVIEIAVSSGPVKGAMTAFKRCIGGSKGEDVLFIYLIPDAGSSKWTSSQNSTPSVCRLFCTHTLDKIPLPYGTH